MGVVQQLLAILDAVMVPNVDPTVVNVNRLVEVYIAFAFVWSFGTRMDGQHRPEFDAFARELFVEEAFPSAKSSSVFGYYLFDDPEQVSANALPYFNPWSDFVTEFSYNDAEPLERQFVHTVHSAAIDFMLAKFLPLHRPFLLMGLAGTGTSTVMNSLLKKRVGIDGTLLALPMKANTSGPSLISHLREHLVYQDGYARLVSPDGRGITVFLDDIDLPTGPACGDFLRAYLEFGGVLQGKPAQRTEMSFRGIGAAATDARRISRRLLRHCSVMWLPTPSDQTLGQIFYDCLQGYMKELQAEVLDDLSHVVKKLSGATLAVYRQLQVLTPPLPDSPHYLLSMHEIARVFRSVCNSLSEAREPSEELIMMIWAHEAERELGDRLFSAARSQCSGVIAEVMKQTWPELEQMDIQNIAYTTLRPVMQTSRRASLAYRRMSTIRSSITRSPSVVELSSEEMAVLSASIAAANQMDAETSGFHMYESQADLVETLNRRIIFMRLQQSPPILTPPLIMSPALAQHITRICRVLHNRGHALLFGPGGCGRRAALNAAAMLYAHTVVEMRPEISSADAVINNIRIASRTAGIKETNVLLILPGRYLHDDAVASTVARVIKTGNAPGLFTADDLEEISGSYKTNMEPMGRSVHAYRNFLWERFYQRVRRNLRIAVVVDTEETINGHTWTLWAQRFPSIVRSCTVDTFDAWEVATLRATALRHLQQENEAGDDAVLVAALCADVHTSADVLLLAIEKKEHINQRLILSCHYVEFIRLYTTLLKKKRQEMMGRITALQASISALGRMQDEITLLKTLTQEMAPRLREKQAETKQLLVDVQSKQVDVEACKQTVAAVEVRVKTLRDAAMKLAAGPLLEAALPVVDATQDTLAKLKPHDMNELTRIDRVLPPVQRVADAFCILNGIKPSWARAKELLQQPDVVMDLLRFELHLPSKLVVEELKSFTSHADFTVERVNTYSKAAGALCQWVLAISQYALAAADTDGGHKALFAERNGVVAQALELYSARKNLARSESDLASIRRQYERSQEDLTTIDGEYADVRKRLERAQILWKHLSSRSRPWTSQLTQLQDAQNALPGNVLLTAACVTYSGPLAKTRRTELLEQWVAAAKLRGVPISSSFSLSDWLADPTQLQGLRQFFRNNQPLIESALIALNSKRWPMFADPHSWGYNWSRKIEEKHGTASLTDTDCYFKIAASVMDGRLFVLRCGSEQPPVQITALLEKRIEQPGILQKTVALQGAGATSYNSNFRLFVSSAHPAPSVPVDLASHVCVVSFRTPRELIEAQLMTIALRTVRVELAESIEKKHELLTEARGQYGQAEVDAQRYLGKQLSEVLATDEASKAAVTYTSASSAMQKTTMSLALLEKKTDDLKRLVSRASIICDAANELWRVDPAYQFSLQFLYSLFQTPLHSWLELTEPHTEKDEHRVLCHMFSSITRTIHSAHRLAFASIVASAMERIEHGITKPEWEMFVHGISDSTDDLPTLAMPNNEWLTRSAWASVCNLSKNPLYAKFAESLAATPDAWRPFVTEGGQGAIPDAFAAEPPFRQALMLRALRPADMATAARRLVCNSIGPDYLNVPLFEVDWAMQYATHIRPVMLILAPRAPDPTRKLLRLAATQRHKLWTLSPAGDSDENINSVITTAMQLGEWVYLANCHLAPRSVNLVERLMFSDSASTRNLNFRMFISVADSSQISMTLLTSCVPVSCDVPHKTASILEQTFGDASDRLLEAVTGLPQRWRVMSFRIALLHTCLVSRTHFGGTGWTAPYWFDGSDFGLITRASREALDFHTAAADKAVLQLCRLIYGGQMGAMSDRLLLEELLHLCFVTERRDSASLFNVQAPREMTLSAYRRAANEIAGSDEQLLGLSVIPLHKSTTQVVLQKMAPQTVAASQTVIDVIDQCRRFLPPLLSTDAMRHSTAVAATADAPSFTDALAHMWLREFSQFNLVVNSITTSLQDLSTAVKNSSMTLAMIRLADDLVANVVPAQWLEAVGPSSRTLLMWLRDLNNRAAALREYANDGMPDSVWLSGLFAPKALPRAVMQNFARARKVPLHKVHMQYTFVAPDTAAGPPETGLYVRGLLVEGARWDERRNQLRDPVPGIGPQPVGLVWMEPSLRPAALHTGSMISCPVYLTADRADGPLQGSGDAEQYLFSVDIKTQAAPVVWLQRGIALLCQTDVTNVSSQIEE
eukprot:TRINITY_DN2814_c0_g1_i3.p1 TRINITY_DN2814_c0_g1~~TRINITY_DN2814_c0_g1_i3.p1  ORF type:complete len:2293 (+),score=665.59 TRINITY_DN2814_c0_g1_i3:305-6880(+)